MNTPLYWQPTRAAALAALADFLPRAGHDYAHTRNEDRGPDNRTNVSRLSPWIRVRLLTEAEVVAAVLKQHSYEAAEKFIQEVCWRTYWKGWLEARPSVWSAYRDELARTKTAWNGNLQYRAALEGRTGIDCFDAFARELVETGYLHNHARMWFASIWIFTLKLPWTLGADFFFRHLLDGDPASNTLSWRWVAGLQTAGKHYVATADNIRRFTTGRFRVDARLADNPLPLTEEFVIPPPAPLPTHHEALPGDAMGLLVSEDDVAATDWLIGASRFTAIAMAIPVSAYRSGDIDPRVIDFRRKAIMDAADRQLARDGTRVTLIDEPDTASAIVSWAREHNLRCVIMAEPSVGLWDEIKPKLTARLHDAGINLIFRRHAWDDAFYPHATKGFFHLKRSIPSVIKSASWCSR